MTAPATYVTTDEAATRHVARTLAATLAPGAIVLLEGELGAGKTAFVKGLAQGLGLDPDDVTSPTFTLVHEYLGGRLPLVHLDLYRLATTELDEVGLDPDLAARGIVVVEWAERLARVPADAVVVRIADRGGDSRAIEIQPVAG
ncbi:MAG: tRNA (adenosine(37)-N6)-threonylcarbamoyltransferase complex ATPase subunit type 1 TsaE [Vicinamibacterales bacterium]